MKIQIPRTYYDNFKKIINEYIESEKINIITKNNEISDKSFDERFNESVKIIFEIERLSLLNNNNKCNILNYFKDFIVNNRSKIIHLNENTSVFLNTNEKSGLVIN